PPQPTYFALATTAATTSLSPLLVTTSAIVASLPMLRLQLGVITAFSEGTPDALCSIALALHHLTKALTKRHTPYLTLNTTGILDLGRRHVGLKPKRASAIGALRNHLGMFDDRIYILQYLDGQLLAPILTIMRPRS